MGRWRQSCCALLLLGAAVAGCGHPVDPSVVDPFDVLREKLSQTVTVDWDGVPLERGLQELGEQQGVAIHCDAQALEEGGASANEPITLHVHGVRLRSLLRLLTEDTDRAYQVREDGIWVTSRRAAEEALVVRIYHVADLTRDPRSLDEEGLAGVIRETVAGDRWENAGGSGTIEARPGTLLVKQTYDIHWQIADLLDELRTRTDGADAPTAAQLGPTAAFCRALDARLTLDLNRAPAEILDEIRVRQGISLVVRWRKQAEAEDIAARLHAAPHASPAPMVLTDVTLRTALDLMLEPLGLGWAVGDDVLLVMARDNADRSLSVRIYSIPAEIDAQRSRWRTDVTVSPAPWPALHAWGTRRYLTNDFEEFVKELFEPSSWRDAGGPGNVRATPSRVVVAQTQRVHDEKAQWLDQLRRASDPRVLDYDERATSPQAERLWRALEQPVTARFLENQCTLRQALDQFVKQHGLPNVLIDDRDYDADQHYPQLDVKDVSLAAALDRLLDPIGQGWYVRDNVVVVTSKDVADSTIVNLTYRCPSLASDDLASGDPATMMDLVKNFVRPDSWKHAGGPGDGLWVFGNVLSVSQTCAGHREVRQFLRQWEAVHDAAPGGPPRFAASPAEERLRAKLDGQITFSCKDRPLIATVPELARLGGAANIWWDWSLIKGATSTEFFQDLHEGKLHETFQAAEEPACDALTRLLRPHGLSWIIMNDALCVTASVGAAARPVTGFYKLPRAVIPSAHRADALVDLVKSHVDPESWKDAGGTGQIDLVSGNVLVVSHSWPVHREVRLFLQQLAASLDAPSGTCLFAVPPGEQPLFAALQRPVTYAGHDRLFREVLAALAERGGVPIALDEPALDDPVFPELERVRVSLDVKDEPLDDALARLLEPRGLQWVMQNDRLLVARLTADSRITGFYNVPKGVISATEDIETLRDVIKSHIRSESWKDSGGSGVVDVFRNTLVVSHSWPVHREVRRFLRQLKVALDAPAGTVIWMEPPSEPLLATGFYRVPDEVLAAVRSTIVPLPDDPPGLAEDCLYDWLLELCEPAESWRDNGGEGVLSVLRAFGGKSVVLVVSSKAAVHRKVKGILDRLRSNPRLPEEQRQKLKEIQEGVRQRAKMSAAGDWSTIPVVG